MQSRRTTYRYHFKLGNKIVHTGITRDIDLRELEHQSESGWEKGHIYQVGYRVPYQEAVEWELQQAAKGKPVKQELREALNASRQRHLQVPLQAR